MTDHTDEPRRLTPDELRTLFLFESLTGGGPARYEPIEVVALS